MEDAWIVFCGKYECSNCKNYFCGANLEPLYCVNHALVICFDLFLLSMLFYVLIYKRSRKGANSPSVSWFRGISCLQVIAAVFSVLVGLNSLALGFWKLETASKSVLPLHWWLLLFLHGVTCLLVGSTVSLRGKEFSKSSIRCLSVLSVIFAGISCGLSLIAVVIYKLTLLKMIFDILSLLTATLLLFCSYKGYRYQDDVDDLYVPLNRESHEGNKPDSTELVTPFARAGFFSRISFWWLNPLMRKGREKTLEDKDIPKLREADRAETCFLLYLEQLNKQRRLAPWKSPSTPKIILKCYWKEIFMSGLFALLKIITLSVGPLLLNSFIEVAEGKEGFKNEGYVLAVLLFLSKTMESLSQRQWYFRSRLIGIKIRSLFTAAIYKKQLRLSNTARMAHSSGEIMNYVTVDAYRIGEFPFWFHQTWTTSLQILFALAILFRAVGSATFAAVVVIVLTVLCNAPLAKLQHKFQSKLMVAQDSRLKAISEALVNMKVLKLYAWEGHFLKVIKNLREEESKWLAAVQLRKSYNTFLFWASPVAVSAGTFGACYFLGVPLHANNVFTFVATLRVLQDPIRSIPDVIGVVIQAKVSFTRIVKFLEAPELERTNVRREKSKMENKHSIYIKEASFSWEESPLKLTLRNISLKVSPGEKVAICGEVGSGKSTLLAAILGEIPKVHGHIQVYGSIAYVSQSAWIQTGTIRENILFGSALDEQRYQDTLEKCSLVKDIELLPHGDLTEIGERGVNLSGGQKQRIQLARALYRDADIYLLDDPFSAVDAHTATSLFNEYVMRALSEKTVLLVTHQVDFLPAFDNVLLMSDGEILHAGSYSYLLCSSKEFRDLVDAHKETAGTDRVVDVNPSQCGEAPVKEIRKSYGVKNQTTTQGDQLIKQEEKEVGDIGFRPYIQYLSQNKGFLFFFIATMGHLVFVIGQIMQNSWMAANVENPNVGTLRLIVVYLLIGLLSTSFLFLRSLLTVVMGMRSSNSIFSQLLRSLFRAPMSFYDSTPLGRILSRVSSDLSIVDLDLPFTLLFSVGSTTNTYSNLLVLAAITWQVLCVSIPMVYIAIRLQRYYFASTKELMRINGTTKSFVANHLAESVAGAMTIRAFKEEERFFAKNLHLIDTNASPFFHNFAANEWLIQRLETLGATVLAASALCMVLLPSGNFSSGFIGMALSYGLSLNNSLVFSIQNQCTLANYIISVERLHQYMDIPSEGPEVIEENRPPINWPRVGRVEIHDLKIRYRPDAPLVLRGISCTFEGGHKIGIVGRTGSGKTTLIGALFRLVEPVSGKIIVDGLDISTVGLHDLRSRFGIIPQDPTLFNGTVRYNLDPLSQHSDASIWEVLVKCQLGEAVQEKEGGLDSLVMDDGSNWSMGQRQLFCLGRALLRRSKILVLDEATASIDNATDLILQKTIRSEFADCTVITVAHRIPTVMDCTMVLAISDGSVMEYDNPGKLMKNDNSLFGQLVKEYWSHYHSAELH